MLDEISEQSQEVVTEPEPTSKFHSLSVTTLTESSVNLQWKYIPPEELSNPSIKLVFKLLRLETRGEWKSIAWTRKTSCDIKNLEQNVCYSLKLLVLVERESAFEVVYETDVFKVSFNEISMNSKT